jgi:hypothetical protein
MAELGPKDACRVAQASILKRALRRFNQCRRELRPLVLFLGNALQRNRDHSLGAVLGFPGFRCSYRSSCDWTRKGLVAGRCVFRYHTRCMDGCLSQLEQLIPSPDVAQSSLRPLWPRDSAGHRIWWDRAPDNRATFRANVAGQCVSAHAMLADAFQHLLSRRDQ